MTALRTVDYHTGGEPFRIVIGGVEPLEGATILERRRDALERLDHARRLLVNEPRGHAAARLVGDQRDPLARPDAEADVDRVARAGLQLHRAETEESRGHQ